MRSVRLPERNIPNPKTTWAHRHLSSSKLYKRLSYPFISIPQQSCPQRKTSAFLLTSPLLRKRSPTSLRLCDRAGMPSSKSQSACTLMFSSIQNSPESLDLSRFGPKIERGLRRCVAIPWAWGRVWWKTANSIYAEQKQLTKSYYGPYMEKTQPMWAAMRKFSLLILSPFFLLRFRLSSVFEHELII